MSSAGNGKAYQWLQDHLSYDGDYCLIWPFYRNPNGYGQLGYEGTNRWAHRFMCELVNGPPPSPDHEAAHSCGNGAGGCAHPKHLSWKTKSENLLDCAEHGTSARNTHGSMGRLSAKQVQEIRDLKGKKTQAEIAAIYGIHEPSVRDIFLGRTYGRPSKIKYFTPDEDAKIRDLGATGRYNYSQIARAIGRNANSVTRRAKEMGIASAYDGTKPDNSVIPTAGQATRRTQ